MIGVVGAGAFGTALAIVEARAGREVTLWGRDPCRPGGASSPRVRLAADLAALRGAEAVLLALPAQATASFLAERGAALPDAPLVLCGKGIDARDFRLQSEIAAGPGRALAVLTGPGFAAEMARGLPTALTLACTDAALGATLQNALATPILRLYLSEDVVGAQLGGALKNVVAIGCGMVEGAGLGQSARAALMTRGFAEMVRLSVAMGARAETLGGLAGLGDLSLTCNSPQSRNFALGRALGIGENLPDGTVEGVATARAACELAARRGIEMPVAAAVADVLDGAITLDGAIAALMARPLKEE